MTIHEKNTDLEIGEKGKGLIDNKAAAGLKHLLGISQSRLPISTTASTLSSEGPDSCHHRRSGYLPYSEDSKWPEGGGGGESRRQVAAAGAGEDDTPGGEARDAVAEDDVEAHRDQAQNGGQPPPQVPAAHHQPRPGAPAAHPPFLLSIARWRGWIWRLCRGCGSELCGCLI